MIYGERIRLRAVERTDLSAFVMWLNDPEVTEGLGIYLPFSLTEEENWYEEMLKHPAEERVMGIEVRQDASGAGEESWKLIGTCGLMHIDHRNGHAELGISIGEKTYWNKGYGTETVRLLTKHGFHTLNLHRVFLRVFENNHRAIHAYEKAGYQLEGRQRQAEFKHGKYLDMLVMSILSDEFSEV